MKRQCNRQREDLESKKVQYKRYMAQISYNELYLTLIFLKTDFENQRKRVTFAKFYYWFKDIHIDGV